MSDWRRQNRKRVSFDIPTFIFNAMKISAVNQNCTMTKWITRLVIRQLKKEESCENKR